MDTVVSNQDNPGYRAGFFLLQRERQLSISFPIKKAILVVGDLLLLNLALFLALTFRQLDIPSFLKLSQHLLVFNLIHASWLLIFYSMGLYDIQLFAVPKAVERKLIQGIGIAGILTIVLFYSLSFVEIQPKTVLLMDLTFSGILLLGWRKWFIRYNHSGSKVRILLCGRKTELEQLEAFSNHNGHLGYEVSHPLLLWDGNNGSPAYMILDRLQKDHIDILAITRALSEDSKTRGLSYQLLCAGVPVIEFSRLAEEFTGKIPVSVINEVWFVENLKEFNKLGFEIFKRCLDIGAAVILGILALGVSPIVGLAIKLDSSGPVFFRQKRTGKGGREFNLIKFRTMKQDAEAEGAQWAVVKDVRITRVGRLLRRTRIDELPQLWNVLKGDMSLVGPRPERPEFVDRLARSIPFYEARHLVKPGLTGWAQINFTYGASVEDALEKLQLDLYYIKNRSIALELSTLLKTIGTVLRYEGR
jgi:exopolysaccharide biosynthesis polyprenyl glycosylphosphotransferase